MEDKFKNLRFSKWIKISESKGEQSSPKEFKDKSKRCNFVLQSKIPPRTLFPSKAERELSPKSKSFNVLALESRVHVRGVMDEIFILHILKKSTT